MSDKPLHVQVAEALGCPTAWDEYCRCPGLEHSGEEHPPRLARFDTDWSATGPLIEKYEISVGPGATEAGPWAAISGVFVDGGGWDGLDFDYRGKGPTPLIAVCHLLLALKKAGKL